MKGMLGARPLRWLKGIHETLVATLLGGLATVTALLLLKGGLPAGQDPYLLDRAMFVLFDTLITYAFFGILATGLAFSLFSNWGFCKHRWILVKWIGFTALFALAWFGWGPALGGLVGLSEVGLHRSAAAVAYAGHQVRALTLALAMTATATGLVFVSVLKPWGLWQRRPAVARPIVLALASLLVLGIAGMTAATMLQLNAYRRIAIADSDLSDLPDGVYRGEAEFGGFAYRVAVTVQAQRIEALRAEQNRRGGFARLAEGVFVKMLQRQNANVDAVTGATTTSKALMKAVEQALSGGPASALQP